MSYTSEMALPIVARLWFAFRDQVAIMYVKLRRFVKYEVQAFCQLSVPMQDQFKPEGPSWPKRTSLRLARGLSCPSLETVSPIIFFCEELSSRGDTLTGVPCLNSCPTTHPLTKTLCGSFLSSIWFADDRFCTTDRAG